MSPTSMPAPVSEVSTSSSSSSSLPPTLVLPRAAGLPKTVSPLGTVVEEQRTDVEAQAPPTRVTRDPRTRSGDPLISEVVQRPPTKQIAPTPAKLVKEEALVAAEPTAPFVQPPPETVKPPLQPLASYPALL